MAGIIHSQRYHGILKTHSRTVGGFNILEGEAGDRAFVAFLIMFYFIFNV